MLIESLQDGPFACGCAGAGSGKARPRRENTSLGRNHPASRATADCGRCRRSCCGALVALKLAFASACSVLASSAADSAVVSGLKFRATSRAWLQVGKGFATVMTAGGQAHGVARHSTAEPCCLEQESGTHRLHARTPISFHETGSTFFSNFHSGAP